MATDTAPVAAPQAPDVPDVPDGPPPGAEGDASVAASVAKGKAEKPAKGSKAGKKAGRKGKGKKGEETVLGGPDGSAMSLSAHPRAARRLAEAKAWGALGGFAAGGYLSLGTHTLLAAGLRALAAGVVCWVVVWAVAVFLWRRLVVAELRHAEHELLAARLAGRGPVEPPKTLNAGER